MVTAFAILMVVLAIAAVILIMMGTDANEGWLVFFGVLALLLVFAITVIICDLSFTGYPAEGQLGLSDNAIVSAVWSQPSPDAGKFLAVIMEQDGGYRLFTLDKQPPIGWAKVTSDAIGNKILIPFPPKPEAVPPVNTYKSSEDKEGFKFSSPLPEPREYISQPNKF